MFVGNKHESVQGRWGIISPTYSQVVQGKKHLCTLLPPLPIHLKLFQFKIYVVLKINQINVL